MKHLSYRYMSWIVFEQYLVLLSWSSASQNNQPSSPVLHVVEEVQLAWLNQVRLEMGCCYIN